MQSIAFARYARRERADISGRCTKRAFNRFPSHGGRERRRDAGRRVRHPTGAPRTPTGRWPPGCVIPQAPRTPQDAWALGGSQARSRDAVDLGGEVRRGMQAVRLGAVLPVPHGEDLAFLVGSRHEVSPVVGNDRGDLPVALQAGPPPGRRPARPSRRRSARRRPRRPVPSARKALDVDRVGGVGLVDHDQLGHTPGADLAEHLADGRDLRPRVGVGCRRPRAGSGRPPPPLPASSGTPRPADAAGAGRSRPCRSSVNQPAGRGPGPAHGRVQRGEQRVVHQHAGPGQPVEQARLARRWCSRRSPPTGTVAGGCAAALDLPARRHLRDLAAQLGGPRPDPPPVRLDLRLAGTPGADPAAVRPPGRPPAGTATRPSRAAAAAGTRSWASST